jgi:hypothetical protein
MNPLLEYHVQQTRWQLLASAGPAVVGDSCLIWYHYSKMSEGSLCHP